MLPPTAIQTGSSFRQGRGAVVELGPELSSPGDALCHAWLTQQGIVLYEQLIVAVEVVAEQRERLDERTSSGHDLGAATRYEIQRGEVLEDADGVGGGQNRSRTGQSDVLSLGGDRRQDDGRRRDCEIQPMMFANAEHIQPYLIGKTCRSDDLADSLHC